MRIESFTVSGFANFTQPVALTPLEEVNVVYGPNNVGKSNLLRAVELYLRLLGAGETVSKEQAQLLDAPDDTLRALLSAAFHHTEPQPINFAVEWTLTEKDLEEGGLFREHPCSKVSTQFEVKQSGRTWDLRIQRWKLGDRDVAPLDKAKEPGLVVFASQIRRLLADACPFQFDQPVLPYALIGGATSGFPQELRDRLFDARQSVSRRQRQRWALFTQLAGTLAEELGPGSWDTTFDRTTGKADVIYLRDESSVSLDSVGAGVARMACLLAELCLAQERCVCLEEPEYRLSPAMQRRFLSLARRLLGAGIGPTQLLITTHSPITAACGAAFALEAADGTPALQKKPWSEPAAAGPAAGEAPPSGELSHLIGLVESLAEIDPNQLAGAAAR